VLGDLRTGGRCRCLPRDEQIVPYTGVYDRLNRSIHILGAEVTMTLALCSRIRIAIQQDVDAVLALAWATKPAGMTSRMKVFEDFYADIFKPLRS
jgi:hypothetical protein